MLSLSWYAFCICLSLVRMMMGVRKCTETESTNRREGEVGSRDEHYRTPRHGTVTWPQTDPPLLHRNVQRLQGGPVIKAHILCVSLNPRLEST